MKVMKAVLVFVGGITGGFVGWYYYNDPKSIALGVICGGFITSMFLDWVDD